MTVQKKILDLTGSQYLVQKVKSAINDVDSSLSTHIADTDIHVTTADKNKWNNGVSQSYVFRYSSTALVASSTNSNTLLDNTDNLKVGDKVIDSNGVLFSITAIDTANSTFTIGTALVDLAQDSDVVHKTGDETSTGFKQFSNIRLTNSIKGINLDSTTTDLNNCYSEFTLYGESRSGNIQYYYCNTDSGTANISNLPEAKAFVLTSITTRLLSTSLYVKQILINSNSKTFVRYCNNSTWSSWVNETDSEYVHKSGDETINGNKTFGNGTLIVNNSIGNNVHGEIKLYGSRPGYIVADNASDGVFDNNNCGVSILLQDIGKPLHIGGYKVDSNGRVFVDNTNKNPVLSITSSLVKTSSLVPENDTGNSAFRILSQLDYANGNPSKVLDVRFIQYDNANATSAIYSNDDGKTSLGATAKRWSGVYATNYYYGNDNVEFSTKFVTSDTNQTIEGIKTFTNSIILQNSDTSGLSRDLSSKSQVVVLGDTVSGDNTKYRFVDKNNNEICYIRQRKLTNSNTDMSFCVNNIDNNNNSISAEINFVIDRNNEPRISPSVTDSISLGRPSFRWKSIYSNSYYYGNVEFSTKFVTTDTAQTISGSKTFEGVDLKLKSVAGEYAVSSGSTSLLFYDKNSLLLSQYKQGVFGSGISYQNFSILGYDSNNQQLIKSITFSSSNLNLSTAYLRPDTDNAISLGRSNNRWSDVQTYKVNALEPSSLSLPSGNASDVIDISSYFSNRGTGETNSYTASANGWIYLRLGDISGCQATVYDSNNNIMWGQSTTGSVEHITIPILKGQTLITRWNTSSSVYVAIARFIPCQGNV